MPDLADEVFSLCLAVTDEPVAAAGAAGAALRLGGWSRTMALGHGAREACAAARPHGAGSPVAAEPSGGAGPAAVPGTSGGTGVTDGARWLAAGRPAEERAVLHLADSDGLTGARLARALGVSEAEAAGRVAAAAAAWESELDPALMAWLGPGGCPDLAEVLGQAVTPVGEAHEPGLDAAGALDLAPATAGHVEGCPVCTDRLRAMVSVRELLGREAPVAAPAVVRAAARSSRARPPSPLGGPARRGRRRTPAIAAVVLVGTAAAAIAYLAWPSAKPGGGQSAAAVAALSRLPRGGSSLVLDPPATNTGRLRLSDVGSAPVSWQAATTAQWVRVAPASGRLAPGQSVTLALDVVGTPVAGLRATVTVNGNDGSVAAARYSP